jgi:hypothetical protein
MKYIYFVNFKADYEDNAQDDIVNTSFRVIDDETLSKFKAMISDIWYGDGRRVIINNMILLETR